MKVALVYDRANKFGGAERVMMVLLELFPDATLFSSVYSTKSRIWTSSFRKIETSFLQRVPLSKNNHDKLAILMPLAFESFNFDDYDLVISVTSESAKGILTSTKTKHICYCLTPTRYLWSGATEYFDSSFKQIISKPFVKYLRKWDFIASQRPDVLISISTEVQKRIRKYYKRDSFIIFPPVITFNEPTNKVQFSDYYLVVARLVKYKKVALAVKVFNKNKKKLIIIGTGKEMKNLKSMSNRNIVFLGKVDDDDLAKYYKNAKALIMPQLEDFGLVAIEAQSLGTPVIAYDKGGSLDTVINGKTGLLFEQQTVDSLSNAINKFQKMHFDKDIIKKNAKRFNAERFKNEFMELVRII